MQRIFSFAAATTLMAMVALLGRSAQAASVYGSLYEVGNLQSASIPGDNFESIIMYYPGEDGFVAVTTSQTGESEWYTSDAYGTVWTLTETSPLDAYDCRQPGRHGIHVFEEEVYFSMACGDGGAIFKLTGQESAELVHQYADGAGYPVVAEYDGKLYYFFDGGFSVWDGASWTDTTTTANQPAGVPLEIATEFEDLMWLAFTTGEVATFDGTSYTIIGESYLEADGVELRPGNANLPSIESFNDTVYVGNQDFLDGATLFKYDRDDVDEDEDLWEEVLDLDSDNSIINKMVVSQSFDGNQYLIIFVTNATEGVNILAMDEDENVVELIDAGLGGTNPENNTEVVDVIRRTVTVDGESHRVMLFSSQNDNDETKIFVLTLGDDFAYTPTDEHFVSAKKKQKTDVHLSEGSVLKVKVPKKKVNTGDVFSLWVDGEKVFTKTAKNGNTITLRYKASQKLDSGDTFTIQVGRKMSYGTGKTRVLARNTILGDELTVEVD